MDWDCGIYWVDPDGNVILCHNEALSTAQARVDKYNETPHAAGRYVIGPWIDFANGPPMLPRGLVERQAIEASEK